MYVPEGSAANPVVTVEPFDTLALVTLAIVEPLECTAKTVVLDIPESASPAANETANPPVALELLAGALEVK